jgi:hypothetical protein
VEEHEIMPKITVHGGPSDANADQPEPGPDAVPDPATVTASGEAVEVPAETGETESPELRELHEAKTVADLKAELELRDLSTSGNKPDLVARLVEADTTTDATADADTEKAAE